MNFRIADTLTDARAELCAVQADKVGQLSWRALGVHIRGRARTLHFHQDTEPSKSASEGLIALHGPLNQSTSKLAGALSQSTPNVFVQLVHGVLRRGELGAPGIVVGYTACYLGQPVGIEFTRMPAHR